MVSIVVCIPTTHTMVCSAYGLYALMVSGSLHPWIPYPWHPQTPGSHDSRPQIHHFETSKIIILDPKTMDFRSSDMLSGMLVMVIMALRGYGDTPRRPLGSPGCTEGHSLWRWSPQVSRMPYPVIRYPFRPIWCPQNHHFWWPKGYPFATRFGTP